jgi:hypothetical protein
LIKKREIAFEVKDWKNRTVTLLKDTIRNHVGLYHFDELYVVDALKRNLAAPITVIWNPGAQSEQAIYEIPVGDHPYLQANIKYRGWLKKTLIVSFYAVREIPEGKKLWPSKK